MSKRRKEDVDWRKFTHHKSFKFSLAGFGTAVIAGTFFYYGQPLFVEMNDSFAIKEFKQIGIVGTYRKHYHHFFDTIQSLANADLQHDALVRELASVQKELVVEKTKNTEIAEKEETEAVASRLETEAGSAIARIPDGIEYRVPAQILPHQLQVLGMEYFRKQDYEKSAVIFHELTHLKEDAGFQRPDNYLISAISWYKLKHYEMAADYLRLTQKLSEPGSTIYRESVLWEAMLEKARDNKKDSQKALTKLMSFYPQSEEVTWINQSSRIPASKSKVVKEEPTDKTSEEEASDE